MLLDSVQADDVGHRSHGLWAIDSFNGNSWTSAAALLASSSADYVALQETREVGAERTAGLEAAAFRKGWVAAIAQAVWTDAGGISAGVAILAKKGLGMATPRRLMSSTSTSGPGSRTSGSAG